MADKLTRELCALLGLNDCTKATIELSIYHRPIITKTEYVRDLNGKHKIALDANGKMVALTEKRIYEVSSDVGESAIKETLQAVRDGR